MLTRAAQLNRWFETPLGHRLLNKEIEMLQQVLPHLFGYHILQVGSLGQGSLLESSRINHRCILTRSSDLSQRRYSHVCAHANALPFAADTLDVVLLPHILEFEEYPHQVLREVERILIPEGQVVILGFNPVSFWGTWHWLLTSFAKQETAPWCGRFLPLLRIKDWLALLGFDIKEQHTFFYALPFPNDRLRRYSRLLEKMGERWLGNLGAVYLIVAKKRVATLTPIKPKWVTKKAVVTSVVGTH
jgi:SAM-dependent methyltransferase